MRNKFMILVTIVKKMKMAISISWKNLDEEKQKNTLKITCDAKSDENYMEVTAVQADIEKVPGYGGTFIKRDLVAFIFLEGC